MAKATETKLNELHEVLAETLIEMVTPVDEPAIATKGEGNEEVTLPARRVMPSPAALAVAAKFLKDNSIFSTPEQSNVMDELKAKLRDRSKPSRRDLKDALSKSGASSVSDLGRELLQ